MWCDIVVVRLVRVFYAGMFKVLVAGTNLKLVVDKADWLEPWWKLGNGPDPA